MPVVRNSKDDIQNKKYIESLMKKIETATEVVVQSVAQEVLTWAVVSTVQDSGNAVFHWYANVGGEGGASARYLKGTGHSIIGDRGEARRPKETVDHGDTIASLPGPAKFAAIKPLLEFTQTLKHKIVMRSGNLPTISINNDIPDLSGNDLAHYSSNAFIFIAQSEAKIFGVQRGYQLAKADPRVKNVIS